jgi:hypothetical protein
MVEFIVGLLAVVVLFAAFVQLVDLAATHTNTMVKARKEAADKAMLDLGAGAGILTDPDFIREWREGPDRKRHTPDDTFSRSAAALFDDTVVEKAGGDAAGWAQIDLAPGNAFSSLRGSADPVALFGLVKGDNSKSVSLMSAIQELLYAKDKVDVRTTVWMTWTKGIY